MGLNNYPYTNFHELNLDWVLEQMKAELNRLESLETWKTGADADIEELKTKTTALSGYITALTNAQELLEEQQNTLTALVNTYDSRITTNANNISGLSAWQTTANATLIDYGERIDDLEEFCDDLAEGSLPPELIASLLQYVRDNIPELLEPLEEDIDELQSAMTSVQASITALQTGKMNSGQGETLIADMNSITTAGYYWINSTNTTVNVPVLGENGFLAVERSSGVSNGNIIQRFTTSSTGRTYTRIYNTTSASWTTWHSWAFVDDLTSINSDIIQLQYSVNYNIIPDVAQIKKQMPAEQITTYATFKQGVIDAGSSNAGVYSILNTLNQTLTGHNASGIAIAKYVESSSRIDFIISSGSNGGITIGYIDTTTDAITTAEMPLPDRTLSFKSAITSSADLNDYKDESGYYLMSSIATNSPSDAKTYSMLLVIKSPSSIDTTQMLIHGTSGRIWVRRYHGSPGAWDSWLEITCANVVKIFYEGSIASITSWASMPRTSSTVLTGANFGTYTTNGITIPAGVYRITVTAVLPAKSSGWYGVGLSEANGNSIYGSSGIVHTQAGFSAVANRLNASGIIKVSADSEFKLLFGTNQSSLNNISGCLYIERLD